MSEEQVEETQRRLQLRKGFPKNYKKHMNPQSYLDRSRSTPDPEMKSYVRPGKLYLRSLDPQSRKNYYTIDTDMSRLDMNRRLARSNDRSYQKLPSIKKMKLVRVGPSDKKLQKNVSYMDPTCSSRRLLQRKKIHQGINDSKRICSVNCHSKDDKPKFQRHKQYSRPKLPSRQSISRVEEYLSNEARSRYPQTQLRSYLTKMKLKQEYEEIQVDQQLRYTTYFGLQPEFWKLQTEYVSQMYEQGRMISSIQNYRPYTIPSIPDRQAIAEFIQTYRSIGKEINLSRLIKQPNFLVQYTPSELYFGQMENDEREGLGVLISEKTCFEGLFRANEKLKGVEVTNSGLYRGQFYRNKKEGNGQFQWINGQHYIGQWREGYRHGKGLWTNSKGDSYNGEWARGRGEGYGIYLSEGREYHGDFVDFKKDGWGREKLPNGDQYEGGFKQGLPEGKGVYIWHNGTKYQGEFFHGFRNGKGILSTLDGYTYNGEFVDEKPEGLCQMLMPNGDVYQGYLRNGKKNGRGLIIFAKDRKSLDGYWQNDRFLSKAA